MSLKFVKASVLVLVLMLFRLESYCVNWARVNQRCATVAANRQIAVRSEPVPQAAPAPVPAPQPAVQQPVPAVRYALSEVQESDHGETGRSISGWFFDALRSGRQEVPVISVNLDSQDDSERVGSSSDTESTSSSRSRRSRRDNRFPRVRNAQGNGKRMSVEDLRRLFKSAK